MSQTARDTVKRAMRMLGVLIAGTEPTAVQATNGLLALNAMMHAWKGQGVDIGHIDLALSDDVDLADQFLNGCTALLAVELSPEFSRPVPPAVGIMAANGWAALCAEYVESDESRDMVVETALQRIGAGNRGGWYQG